jgi:hypothetical protein
MGMRDWATGHGHWTGLAIIIYYFIFCEIHLYLALPLIGVGVVAVVVDDAIYLQTRKQKQEARRKWLSVLLGTYEGINLPARQRPLAPALTRILTLWRG